MSLSKCIFVTGGIMSSLGKGIVAASLGSLLKSRGFSIRIKKFDPYLNVDPGTMSPYEHGEVFVTRDGAETDLDFGSYERFTGIETRGKDSVTTGKLYQDIIARERKGEFLGKTIQIIPHVTGSIIASMLEESEDVDFTICEIGGTVGDMEGGPFLEAIRQIRLTTGALCVHLSYVPYWHEEFKTKPTQRSIKDLQACGIQPEILICRCEYPLPLEIKKKVALFCNIQEKNVINGREVQNIYEAPIAYHEEGLDAAICNHFSLERSLPDLTSWRRVVKSLLHSKRRVSIGIIGKYGKFQDTYRSLIEALHHGGIPGEIGIDIKIVDADSFDFTQRLDGIVVPGGFGERCIEEMIRVITHAREKKIPFFGICLGMQLAVIETLRTLGGLTSANSLEFNPETPHGVIGLLKEWMEEGVVKTYETAMGGTMRLGSFPCRLEKNTKFHAIYGKDSIKERHRHRYEVNSHYIPKMEACGLHVSGYYVQEGFQLVECVERKDHPWFLATQFHPEFQSRPFSPHPLFQSFVETVLQQQQLSE